MIEIIVKMPSLSPTLKWLRVSLAPTRENSCRHKMAAVDL